MTYIFGIYHLLRKTILGIIILGNTQDRPTAAHKEKADRLDFALNERLKQIYVKSEKGVSVRHMRKLRIA